MLSVKKYQAALQATINELRLLAENAQRISLDLDRYTKSENEVRAYRKGLLRAMETLQGFLHEVGE